MPNAPELGQIAFKVHPAGGGSGALMDDEGYPKRLDEVEQVRDFDRSPFVLGEIESRDFRPRPAVCSVSRRC